MSREKWQTVVSNKITVVIIHRFPTSSNSLPFKLPCSNGWHQAFVKVKVERPTPNDTTDQFFHFFRSASLLLLSIQFQHLETMPKCKASRNVREIVLINARPSHWLLITCFLSGFAVGDTLMSADFGPIKTSVSVLSFTLTSDRVWFFFFFFLRTHKKYKAVYLSVTSNSAQVFWIYCPMTSMLL